MNKTRMTRKTDMAAAVVGGSKAHGWCVARSDREAVAWYSTRRAALADLAAEKFEVVE